MGFIGPLSPGLLFFVATAEPPLLSARSVRLDLCQAAGAIPPAGYANRQEGAA
jgi:hypothetical protein